MSDNEEAQVVSTGLTARVADGYGDNPHEHKPSQDPFAPDVDQDVAEAKQAVSAGADVDDETREKADRSWDGISSSTSSDETPSTEPRTDSDSTPASSAESPSAPGRRGSSTARSTGTGRSGSSRASS